MRENIHWLYIYIVQDSDYIQLGNLINNSYEIESYQGIRRQLLGYIVLSGYQEASLHA